MWMDYQGYGPENLKAGDRLRVVRLPVYQRNDPPAEKESIKTVIAVHRGKRVLVQLKEHTERTGGVKVHRYFEASSRVLFAGPPKPLRFEVLEVEPALEPNAEIEELWVEDV